MTPAAVLLLTAVAAAPPDRPHAAVRPVGPADARWTTGFWADRWETCRTATVPAMGRLMAADRPSQFLHNFRVVAGDVTGKHRGAPWNDGDLYKWVEAAAVVQAVKPDPETAKLLGEAVAVIAKAQRADGYLHTPALIAARNGDPGPKAFADRLDFEMYNFGHLFTAAVAHRRATGSDGLLTVARKAADFLCREFANPTPERARNAVCPAHYMGVLDLYRETGDTNYLRLAKTFLAMRDLAADGTDDNQDRVPFRDQADAVGHAVRATYLYAGAADLALETGDPALTAPLAKVWASVAHRKLAITGACGALFDGASPDGTKDQKRIARVHQSFGRDYQLPHSTAHNETCAAVGNVLWNARMLQLTGDAKHADVMELSLLNAVLAGQSLDGTRFFYTNTLRQLDRMPAPLRWSRTRQEWISCYCCPPNVARTIARSAELAYGRSDRGAWVHLYGGSTLDTELPGGRLKLTQATDYPWDGRVVLTLAATPAGETSLFLRIPGWANDAAVSVNGKSTEPGPLPAGQYAELRRAWHPGDRVELTLPMPARLVEAHPLVEECRGQVAVMRGPLVYCIESPDLPAGVTVQDVRILPDAVFAARFETDRLGGVVVLDADSHVVRSPGWGNALYRDVTPAAPRAVRLTLVPYFAWGNRGRSEMTVWVPTGR